MSACKAKVCRICFAMDCELHLLQENTELYKGYEAVTGLMMAGAEDLPRYLCTSCADQLMTCAHFRHRTLQAHLMLLDILKNSGHISVESIQAVTKQTHGDTDNGQTEEGAKFEDFQVKIKCENISLDSPNFNEELKIEYDPNDVGADDLVRDEAVAPFVEMNDDNVFNVASVADNMDGTELRADFKMAESNGNDFISQNNQENVTIVKVDVHHQYSQVTQTVGRKKALNITTAKQKKLKHTKTAQRMKDDKRKKLNQATSVISSVHHYVQDNVNNSHAIALSQDINSIYSELDDNMPCVKICVKSTNGSPSAGLNNSHEIAAASHNLPIPRIPCIKIRIESTSDTSSIVHHQDIILHGDNLNSLRIVALPGQNINVVRTKSAAERMREIIALRKKRIKGNTKKVKVDTLEVDAILSSQEVKPRGKTKAERMQEYSDKKKAKVECESNP